MIMTHKFNYCVEYKTKVTKLLSCDISILNEYDFMCHLHF